MDRLEENYKTGEVSKRETNETAEKEEKNITDINSISTGKENGEEVNCRKRKIMRVQEGEEMPVNDIMEFYRENDISHDNNRSKQHAPDMNMQNTFNIYANDHTTGATHQEGVNVNHKLPRCNGTCRSNTLVDKNHICKREDAEANRQEDNAIGNDFFYSNENCSCVANYYYLEINAMLKQLHIAKMQRRNL